MVGAIHTLNATRTFDLMYTWCIKLFLARHVSVSVVLAVLVDAVRVHTTGEFEPPRWRDYSLSGDVNGNCQETGSSVVI